MSTNSVAIIQGEAGDGKTTLLREHALGWLRQGAWVILQDPDAQFAHGGEASIPARRYASAGEFRRAYEDARRRGEPLSRAASIDSAEDEPVTELAIALAESQSAPVLVGYDEAVLVQGATPHYVSARFRDMMARRRHRGIAVEILAQDFGLLHALWQRMATDCYLFWTRDMDRIQVIAKRFSIDPKDLAAQLSRLRPHHYLHISKRDRLRMMGS